MLNEENNSLVLDRDVVARLKDAMQAGPDELLTFLQDPAADIVKAAIRNPLINESHVLTLLKRRDLHEDILRAIWNSRIAKDNHPIKVAIAHHPATSAAHLSEVLPFLYLFDLATLCALPGIAHDQKIAAERAIIRRLPTTPLGNKITLAHRATAAVVEQLLKEADSRVMAACLDNTQLKEGMLFQFLRSAASTPETISMIARHPRWKNMPSLKHAILTNPKTPLIWFTQWLKDLKFTEIRNIYNSQRLSQVQRREVQTELKRRGGSR
jgi:hypothetical protein